MFDWDDARYFLAVARAGSLSSAGRQLNTNQSTVGRRLAGLEERLGASLFLRTGDGYVLTAVGEQLVPRAERIEEEATAIEREIAGHEARLTGMVRLTGPDALAPRLMVPICAELQRQHPQIVIEMVADNRALSLSKREADMAVRLGRSKEPTLVGRRLSDFGTGLYASRAYVAKYGLPRGDFAGHRLVDFDDPGRTWADARWVEQNRGKAEVVMRTSSSWAMLEAVKQGIGFAALPAYLCDVDPDLVQAAPPSKVFVQQLWLLMHRDLQHSAKVRVVSDVLVAAFERLQKLLRGK